METNRVNEYLSLSRRWSRTLGSVRRNILRARMDRLWEAMTPEERAEVTARWRDPS